MRKPVIKLSLLVVVGFFLAVGLGRLMDDPTVPYYCAGLLAGYGVVYLLVLRKGRLERWLRLRVRTKRGLWQVIALLFAAYLVVILGSFALLANEYLWAVLRGVTFAAFLLTTLHTLEMYRTAAAAKR